MLLKQFVLIDLLVVLLTDFRLQIQFGKKSENFLPNSSLLHPNRIEPRGSFYGYCHARCARHACHAWPRPWPLACVSGPHIWPGTSHQMACSLRPLGEVPQHTPVSPCDHYLDPHPTPSSRTPACSWGTESPAPNTRQSDFLPALDAEMLWQGSFGCTP